MVFIFHFGGDWTDIFCSPELKQHEYPTVVNMAKIKTYIEKKILTFVGMDCEANFLNT